MLKTSFSSNFEFSNTKLIFPIFSFLGSTLEMSSVNLSLDAKNPETPINPTRNIRAIIL
jgi:hypothetical protein